MKVPNSINFRALLVFSAICIFLLRGFSPSNQTASNVQVEIQNTNRAIIWDLGGVLIDASKMKAAWKIGLWDLICYSERGQIKSKTFDILNMLGEQVPHSNGRLAKDSEGHVLPQVMCDWLAGIPTNVIMQKVDILFKNLSIAGYFKNQKEEKILYNLIKFIFNSKDLADCIKLNKKVLKILDKCAETKNPFFDGKTKLIVLSNFSEEAFEILQQSKNGKKLFEHFNTENIVISGKINLIKPSPEIFEFVINKYNLDPKLTIFIDDQKENIEAAKQLGLDAIHFDGNHKKLEGELALRGYMATA